MEKDPKEKVREFLHKNEELEDLKSLLSEFNIFEALGVVKKEVRHSNFLAWLLDPKETHGLDDYFLIKFLKEVCYSMEDDEEVTIVELDTWDFDRLEVKREEFNIDILIVDDENEFVCAIENKVKSSEHGNQLSRYKETLDREFPEYNKFLVYLTAEGEKPSDEDWTSVSHSDIHPLVGRLLETKGNVLSEEIKVFIRHYKKVLERHIMEESELKELCEKIYRKHGKAIDIIEEYKPDKRQEIYKFLKNYIEQKDEWKSVTSTKTRIRFIPENLDGIIKRKGEGWLDESKRILVFQFVNGKDSLLFRLSLGPGENKYRKKLFSIAESDHKFKKNPYLGDRFSTLFQKELLNKEDRESLSISEIKEKLREEIEESLGNKVRNLVSTFEEEL